MISLKESPKTPSSREAPATVDPARPSSARRRTRLRTSVRYVLIAILCVFFVGPVFWMLSTALKAPAVINSYPPTLIPSDPQWSNFTAAVTEIPYGRYLFNSVFYTGLAVTGDIISASFVGFGLARLRSRAAGPLFLIVLATLMVPFQVLMVPQFIMFSGLGWQDSYLPLIVPTFLGSAFGSAFYIFLMRQFYRGIPRELDEAARVDGASYLRVWWSVILPMSKPVVAAVAVLSFLAHWNDYVGPLVYLTSRENYPLSLGLTTYTAAFGGTQWHLLMAGAFIALLPCLVVFFVAQRHLMDAVSTTGSISG